MGNCPLSFMRQKRIVIKSRNKQHGRPRKSQVPYGQYSDNWDAIFAKKDKESQEPKKID